MSRKKRKKNKSCILFHKKGRDMSGIFFRSNVFENNIWIIHSRPCVYKKSLTASEEEIHLCLSTVP